MDAREVIETLYDKFAEGDGPGVMAMMAPDISWIEEAGFPYGGTYIGPDAVAANVLGPLASDWEGFRVQPGTILAEGPRVAALGWYSGRSRATGRSFRARFTHWFTVEDGTITSFEQVADSVPVHDALKP
ncbi:nuclear transport factor 2 family protein [Lolliginicoccus suaedae]|uniref:nuclear transport factor 2 family protein n=1 Tax=Lolliginicoccus suaedae TaxID=2605429 RepID=UPI0011EF4BA2|nr:nuclear transport factor 2 family protein [Lolliginicoccus suaedae]